MSTEPFDLPARSDTPMAPDVSQGPVVPSPAVRQELERALQSDEQLLGEVWRRRQAGESAEEIQAARGAATAGFVWSYERVLKALLEGQLPEAPTVALQVARSLRGFRNRMQLSQEAQSVIDQNVVAIESRAASEAAREVEDNKARALTSQAEGDATPGIYVYALPHYLRHPYDEESGRTLLKVGRSDRSVLQRFRDQTRTTALPEDPVLLRIYPTTGADATARERQFHELLEAADHARSRARTGGTEWFLSSLRFLDVVAKTLGLEIKRVYDPDAE